MRDQVFKELPVPQAVAFMVLPAIVSQIIHVIYNLADTWFVGLTGDPNTVAAISLCLPIYNILTGLSNLFGVGGASVIARYSGYGDTDRARQAFVISVYGALLTSAAYSLAMLFVSRLLLLRIGADAGDIDFALTYTLVTIVIGGIPTVLSAALANLIRAVGDSKRAAFGLTLGAILNIALDPLFMFVLLPKGNEILGAAIATSLSNVVSLVYFVVYLSRSDNDIFAIRPSLLRGSRILTGDVLRSGMPGFSMVAMAMVSNCFLNALIADYGAGAAVAGLGIVRKVDSLAYAVNQGVTQGMLPLVAYSYAARDRNRMKGIISFSAACTVGFSLLCTVTSFILAPKLIGIFIQDADTIRYGSEFLRVLCLCIPVYSVTFVIIAVFQAVGRSLPAFVLSILHKGSLDIMLLFLFRALLGLGRVIWATPVTEVIALITACALLIRFLRERDNVNIREVIR